LFYKFRKDYVKYRTETAKIDSYVATINHNLQIGNINFIVEGSTYELYEPIPKVV